MQVPGVEATMCMPFCYNAPSARLTVSSSAARRAKKATAARFMFEVSGTESCARKLDGGRRNRAVFAAWRVVVMSDEQHGQGSLLKQAQELSAVSCACDGGYSLMPPEAGRWER